MNILQTPPLRKSLIPKIHANRQGGGGTPALTRRRPYNGCLTRAIRYVRPNRLINLRSPCQSTSLSALSLKSATFRRSSSGSSPTSRALPWNPSAAASNGSSPSLPRTRSTQSSPHPTRSPSASTPNSPTSQPTASTASSSSPTSPPASSSNPRIVNSTTHVTAEAAVPLPAANAAQNTPQSPGQPRTTHPRSTSLKAPPGPHA